MEPNRVDDNVGLRSNRLAVRENVGTINASGASDPEKCGCPAKSGTWRRRSLYRLSHRKLIHVGSRELLRIICNHLSQHLEKGRDGMGSGRHLICKLGSASAGEVGLAFRGLGGCRQTRMKDGGKHE